MHYTPLSFSRVVVHLSAIVKRRQVGGEPGLSLRWEAADTASEEVFELTSEGFDSVNAETLVRAAFPEHYNQFVQTKKKKRGKKNKDEKENENRDDDEAFQKTVSLESTPEVSGGDNAIVVIAEDADLMGGEPVLVIDGAPHPVAALRGADAREERAIPRPRGVLRESNVPNKSEESRATTDKGEEEEEEDGDLLSDWGESFLEKSLFAGGGGGNRAKGVGETSEEDDDVVILDVLDKEKEKEEEEDYSSDDDEVVDLSTIINEIKANAKPPVAKKASVDQGDELEICYQSKHENTEGVTEELEESRLSNLVDDIVGDGDDDDYDERSRGTKRQNLAPMKTSTPAVKKQRLLL